MARLIDANALGRFSFHIECEEDGEAFERCVVDWDDIESSPTVDAVEVVHGRWIEMKEPLGFAEINCAVCSVCSTSWVLGDEWDFDEFADWHNYCSCCGAKMDGDSQ